MAQRSRDTEAICPKSSVRRLSRLSVFYLGEFQTLKRQSVLYNKFLVAMNAHCLVLRNLSNFYINSFEQKHIAVQRYSRTGLETKQNNTRQWKLRLANDIPLEATCQLDRQIKAMRVYQVPRLSVCLSVCLRTSGYLAVLQVHVIWLHSFSCMGCEMYFP